MMVHRVAWGHYLPGTGLLLDGRQTKISREPIIFLLPHFFRVWLGHVIARSRKHIPLHEQQGTIG